MNLADTGHRFKCDECGTTVEVVNGSGDDDPSRLTCCGQQLTRMPDEEIGDPFFSAIVSGKTGGQSLSLAQL